MQTTLARQASIARPKLSAAKKSQIACRSIAARRNNISRSKGAVRVSASLNDNIFVNAIASAVTVAIPVAVSVVTAEKSEEEFSRLTTPAGYIPIAAAVAADAVAHSIPGSFCFGRV